MIFFVLESFSWLAWQPAERHTGGGLCCHLWRQTSPLQLSLWLSCSSSGSARMTGRSLVGWVRWQRVLIEVVIIKNEFQIFYWKLHFLWILHFLSKFNTHGWKVQFYFLYSDLININSINIIPIDELKLISNFIHHPLNNFSDVRSKKEATCKV